MAELSNYEKLNPLQRAGLFKRIKEDESLSYKELAKKIDKSASFVANSVRLLDLPIAIKDGLMGGVISEGHARALASLNNPSDCIAVYKEVLKSHATVRETEELVREKKQNQKSKVDIDQKQAKKIKDFLEKLLEVKISEIEANPKVNRLILKISLNS